MLFHSTFLLSQHVWLRGGCSAAILLPSRLRSPAWTPSCTMELGWGRGCHQVYAVLPPAAHSLAALRGRVRWWQAHPCPLQHRYRVGTGRKTWLPKLCQEAMMGRAPLGSLNPRVSLDLAPCGGRLDPSQVQLLLCLLQLPSLPSPIPSKP